MSKVKIYVSYKDKHIPLKSDVIKQIQTGRAIADEIFEEMIGDDTGDNISSLNPSYCELSAFYWIWKNYAQIGNPEHIGFMHHRRHLLFGDNICTENLPICFIGMNEEYISQKLAEQNIPKYISNYDMLVASPIHSDLTLEEQYAFYHHKTDFEYLLEILKKHSMEDYNLMQKHKKDKYVYFLNMFVMPKDMFFEYCSWIFPIIEIFYAQYKEREYDEYQKRLFIGERLTSLFIEKKKLEGFKIKELPFSFVEIPETFNRSNYNKNVIKYWKCKIIKCLTFGQKRHKYKEKMVAIKAKIIKAKSLMKREI
ncbi:MAG: DUF4422 domain-containing protein [Candidatus Gastranaerophilales bacterium]